jgi:hypothetical protein
MSKSSDKKMVQLGEPIGTAQGKLRKLILFQLIQLLNLDICYRCQERISSVSELSIEHIIPWLDSENPIELFYDLDNIAFSHLSCNSIAARKPNKIFSPIGMSWCSECRIHKPLEEFYTVRNPDRARNGVRPTCIQCEQQRHSL